MDINQLIAELTRQIGYAPSKYQIGILEWVLNGEGNGACNAVAGSGKSSSLRMVALALQLMGYKPSEVRVIVFGKENSKDLIDKFGAAWKDSISTLHSCGFRILQQEVGRFQPSERVKAQKYRHIAQEMGYVPSKGRDGELTRSKAIEKPEDLYKAIDLVRLTLSPGSSEDIEQIATHYNIEGICEPAAVAEAVRQILKVGEQQAIQHVIDYADQIWLPVKWELHKKSWFKPFKFVLADEIQDMNAAQLELVVMLAGIEGRILGVGDPRQCQPPGTMVRLPDGTTKPIEEIREGDRVVTYNRKGSSFVKGGIVSETAWRPHEGYLYKISSRGKSSRCTDSHRWLVRWANRSQNAWITYLMRQGDRYRVGQTKLFLDSRPERRGNFDFGLMQRATRERADAAWILKVHDSFASALAYEQIVSAKFGLPQVIFRSFNGVKHYSQAVIDSIYDALYPQEQNALACLKAHGRKLEYPIYSTEIRQRQGRSTLFETQSCNLIPGYMAIPIAPDEINLTNRCSISNWQALDEVEREYYSGLVYSLNIKKYHSYIADGLVTLNSIMGFAGADNRSYQKIVERTKATELPLSICYRCPRSHIDLVRAKFPEPLPLEPETRKSLLPDDWGGLEAESVNILSGRDDYLEDEEPSEMSIEYVLGQEQYTSNWAKFRVEGLEKWAVRSEMSEDIQGKQNTYQSYTCLETPEETTFSIFEQSGNKRSIQKFNFYICVTSSDDAEVTASHSRGRCKGNFKIVCVGESKVKASKLMEWWTKSEEHSLEFAMHCAAHINKRSLEELPPLSPKTEEANTAVEPLSVTEELSPRTEDEEIAPIPQTVNGLQSDAKETPETQRKQWLNLGLIALNAGTQSRKQTNQDTIDDYAEQMADSRWNWEQEPLPIIFSDGKNFYPGDGHHRVMAADKAGVESIFVEIRPGSLREAIFYSTSANKFHGLPRNNADKRNQVELLLQDPQWQLLSDRTIAEHCGVSAPFVGKIRAELAESGTVNISTERIDKSGRRINTTNIGTKPKEKLVLGEVPVVPKVVPELTTKHQDNGVVEVEAIGIPLQEEAINGVQPKVLEQLSTVAESHIELLSQKVGAKTVALIALDFCNLDEIKEIHAELTAMIND